MISKIFFSWYELVIYICHSFCQAVHIRLAMQIHTPIDVSLFPLIEKMSYVVKIWYLANMYPFLPMIIIEGFSSLYKCFEISIEVTKYPMLLSISWYNNISLFCTNKISKWQISIWCNERAYFDQLVWKIITGHAK